MNSILFGISNHIIPRALNGILYKVSSQSDRSSIMSSNINPRYYSTEAQRVLLVPDSQTSRFKQLPFRIHQAIAQRHTSATNNTINNVSNHWLRRSPNKHILYRQTVRQSRFVSHTSCSANIDSFQSSVMTTVNCATIHLYLGQLGHPLDEQI